MEISDLIPTRCAICQTDGNAKELYPANFEISLITPQIFSARRLPDRFHYRLVKCNTCGLVRSDPIASQDTLTQLYNKSVFTYSDQVQSIKKTYGNYLKKLTGFGVKKNSLLEIGCGNGFFLEEAQSQGYQVTWGIEPSEDAILEARADLRANIVCDMMRPGVFESNKFDVICLFQVFDHISDPGGLLDECFNILKPSGLVLCLNHNIESWSANLFKESSPIIDIEHTFLYSPRTLSLLFQKHGFTTRRIAPVHNIYDLSYLAHLFPLPIPIKKSTINFLNNTSFGKIQISVPLGNLYIVAQKPDM